MIAIVDTGFVLAVESRTDKHHIACRRLYQQSAYIYMPQSVLNEVAYFLTKEYGNQVTSRFLKQLPRSKYILTRLEDWDIDRTADLLAEYADSRIDFVDATVIALAERLNIAQILTLDRRDFGIVRPSHIAHFEILPQI
jgi:predicted nucleic acid-binding protein